MRSNTPRKIKKICVVTISLGKGGAERSTALLTKMLSNQGFEVHLVVLTNLISYPYHATLFNLGEFKSEKESFWQRIKRFQRFKAYLLEQNFDVIIDNRPRNNSLKEFCYLHFLYKNSKVIYVTRSYRLSIYFPVGKWPLRNFVAKRMIKKASALVGVSKAIRDEINKKYQINKAIAIYNPVEDFEENVVGTEEKYVLFLGRIDNYTKNLDLLIESFKKSELPQQHIKLKIIGSGPDEQYIKDKILKLELSKHIEMISFTPAIYSYLKNAIYLLLTSRYEGFPRVLIESLSVGTPVISVNCQSGPSEVVQHERNGLLVDNFSQEALVNAMNKLLNDKNLYKNCKKNAQASIAHLKEKVIEKQWSKLINDV